MKTLIAISFVFGFSSFAKSADKTLVDCQNNGNDAGLESLTIVQSPNSGLKAIVTMNLQDAYETYTYRVKLQPPEPRRHGGADIYSAASGKFELAICTTCALVDKEGSRSGNVTFTSPKKARLYPSEKLNYQTLACKVN